MSEQQPTPPTTKQIFITAYAVVAIGFTFYNYLYGVEKYKGFFFNFGKSLAWPFQVFPVLGKIFGAIFLLVFIAVVFVIGPSQKQE